MASAAPVQWRSASAGLLGLGRKRPQWARWLAAASGSISASAFRMSAIVAPPRTALVASAIRRCLPLCGAPAWRLSDCWASGGTIGLNDALWLPASVPLTRRLSAALPAAAAKLSQPVAVVVVAGLAWLVPEGAGVNLRIRGSSPT